MKLLGRVPSVSVLMSCFNATRWLDDAICSVLNQTYTDFEFIIINDGSTDDTLSIIHRYAESDPRIIILNKENTGLTDSLNTGIELARGEWIARIDADDICEPTRLKKQFEYSRFNENLVYIGCGLTIIDEFGRRLQIHGYPLQHTSLLRNLRSIGKFPAHSSAFYRTKVARELGGYRSRLKRAQDWDLWLRLSEVGELACLSEPLVRVRKHSAQISHDEAGRRQLMDSRIGMVSYWLRHYGAQDPLDDDETNYEAFYTWLLKELKKLCFFEIQENFTRIRVLARSMLKSPLNFFVICRIIFVRPILFLKFLSHRIYGDPLPRRLALIWMKRKNACRQESVFIGDIR